MWVGGTSCSTLFLDVGFVDLGVGIVSLLSVHIEEEVVLSIGCRCDVDVGPTVVDVHDVVDDIGAISLCARFSSCTHSCVGCPRGDILLAPIGI